MFSHKPEPDQDYFKILEASNPLHETIIYLDSLHLLPSACHLPAFGRTNLSGARQEAGDKYWLETEVRQILMIVFEAKNSQ